MDTTRRDILTAGGLAFAGATIAGFATIRPGAAKAKGPYAVVKTDAQWRAQLSAAEYRVLRNAGTEPPYSSPLDREKRGGVFTCAGCQQRLFSSQTKFDSGTGWPSFYRPLPGGVGTATDYKIGFPRTEVHCARCGGHLGHVFGDGPKPTGKRYCMNGIAMDFVAG
jgi:peptide-methionine (R)-S-oxide reductase